jgi:ankyrin repeat protein
LKAARTGSVEAVRTLLVHGAKVNAREGRPGQTALMWAVSEQHSDVADFLIEHGADVNETAPDGISPLLMASASGHQELSLFFMDQGEDPNAADEYGTTALHYALQKGMSTLTRVKLSYFHSHLYRPNMAELVKALLAHGANPTGRLVKTQRFGNLVILVRLEGAMPFLLAATVGDVDLMRVLVEGGTDPLLATDENVTPLMVAAGLGRTWDRTDEKKKGTLEAVKLAVELGADVNAVSVNGQTALQDAARIGANDIVQFLVDEGADMEAPDKWGQTPLSIAEGVVLDKLVRELRAEALDRPPEYRRSTAPIGRGEIADQLTG